MLTAVSTRPAGVSLFALSGGGGLGLPVGGFPVGEVKSKFFDPNNLGPPELGGWSPWFSLGPDLFPLTNPITAATSKPGAVSLFILGGDGVVNSKYFDPDNLGPPEFGGWSPWFQLGPDIFPAPSRVTAVSTKPGGMSLFVLGDDGVVRSKFYDPDNLGPPALGGWSPWFPLGNNTFPTPTTVSAVSSKRGGVSLFVLGIDGRVWSAFFDPDNLIPGPLGGWSPWFPIGPNDFPTLSVISAVSSRPGGVSLFVNGYDGQVWSTFFDPGNPGPPALGGWQPWFALGPERFPRRSIVTAVSSRPGGVSLFGLSGVGSPRFLGGEVKSKYFDPNNLGPQELGGWSPWFPVGPNSFPLTNSIAAASSKPGGVSLFILGGDGVVNSKYFDPDNLGPPELGGWSPLFQLGPDRFPSVPTPFCIRLHVKILQTPPISIAAMIARMEQVYASAGINVQHMSTEFLNLPLLNAIDARPCKRGRTSNDQDQLFQNRNLVGPNDLVVYFVGSAAGNTGMLNGCASHPDGQPGAVVAQIASRWTLAHELGHVLGLEHIADENCLAPGYVATALMTGCGTRRIVGTPRLGADEIATMREDALTTQCT